jgi:hypothetical protein
VAVLLPVKQSIAFMQQLQASPEMQQHIKGVLFDDTGTPRLFILLSNAAAVIQKHACSLTLHMLCTPRTQSSVSPASIRLLMRCYQGFVTPTH